MTYDQWKTTDPREYERDEPEEEVSEYELLAARCQYLECEKKTLAQRIKELEASLHECLEYFKDKYDVNDGDYGEPSPNKEMQLGTMIDETLYGIRF